jgi:hypothetical protein
MNSDKIAGTTITTEKYNITNDELQFLFSYFRNYIVGYVTEFAMSDDHFKTYKANGIRIMDACGKLLELYIFKKDVKTNYKQLVVKSVDNMNYYCIGDSFTAANIFFNACGNEITKIIFDEINIHNFIIEIEKTIPIESVGTIDSALVDVLDDETKNKINNKLDKYKNILEEIMYDCLIKTIQDIIITSLKPNIFNYILIYDRRPIMEISYSVKKEAEKYVVTNRPKN